MSLIPGNDAWLVYRVARAVRNVRMWRPWIRMSMLDAITEVVAVEAVSLERRVRELAPMRIGRQWERQEGLTGRPAGNDEEDDARGPQRVSPRLVAADASG